MNPLARRSRQPVHFAVLVIDNATLATSVSNLIMMVMMIPHQPSESTTGRLGHAPTTFS